MNDKITAKEVRLVGADGEQVGVVPLEDALAKAQELTLDLVEVAPDADPPVCKIMDHRRYMFEAKRRLKESKKKSKALELKEIKLRPNIDPHDYGIKMKKAKEFLEKGHKVKVTMRYRPREMRHYEIGTKVLEQLANDVSDVAEVDTGARVKSIQRMQSVILTRKKGN